MLENFFITGTANNLIVQLGNQKRILGSNTYYHTVSEYVSNNSHISQLSTFTAPLVCATAKTKLQKISHILLCVRVPELPPLELIEEKKIESVLHTEWYFTLDLIRRSILLLETSETEYEKEGIHIPPYKKNAHKNHKGRLYIALPYLKIPNMTNTQVLFYKCMIRAIKTIIDTLQHNSQMALVYVSSMVASQDNALGILKFIEVLNEKNIRKRRYFQKPFLKRMFRNN